MSVEVALAVIFAALLHASWNAILKSGTDVLLDPAAFVVGGGVIAVPLVFFVPPPAAASWPYLAASALTHIAYYLLMVNAYRTGDLSLVTIHLRRRRGDNCRGGQSHFRILDAVAGRRGHRGWHNHHCRSRRPAQRRRLALHIRSRRLNNRAVHSDKGAGLLARNILRSRFDDDRSQSHRLPRSLCGSAVGRGRDHRSAQPRRVAVQLTHHGWRRGNDRVLV